MKSILRRSSSTVVINEKPLPSLGACLLMDLLGCASFAIPFFGELFDLIWAPISAMIYWRMFGVRKGFFGGIFSFVEEILPGFDIIPTFTITWAMQYYKRNKHSLNLNSIVKL